MCPFTSPAARRDKSTRGRNKTMKIAANAKGICLLSALALLAFAVVALVRVTDAAWPEQGLVLAGNSPLLAVLDIFQVLLRLSISLRVSCEGTRKTTLPAFRVRAVSNRPRVGSRLFCSRRCGRVDDDARRLASSLELIVDTHSEDGALHACGKKVDSPSTPALPSKAKEQAGSKEKTAGRLNAHHRDAQAAGVFEVICSPDLGNILNAS